MKKSRSFKDLLVWQKSLILAKEVYNFSSSLPKEEKFGLVSQLRRSAISIPSNIAEGSKRSTAKDFRNFLKISQDSLAELETQVILAEDLYSLEKTDMIKGCIIEIDKMLFALQKSLL